MLFNRASDKHGAHFRSAGALLRLETLPTIVGGLRAKNQRRRATTQQSHSSPLVQAWRPSRTANLYERGPLCLLSVKSARVADDGIVTFPSSAVANRLLK